jgi:hypothetical protein
MDDKDQWRGFFEMTEGKKGKFANCFFLITNGLGRFDLVC